MSVIGGIFHFDKRPIDQEHLSRIAQSYAHLGIDGLGTWADASLGFIHWKQISTPESIHERLPFELPGSNLVITAEARIDNRNELSEKLGFDRKSLADLSDSALLLGGYQKWGSDCVDELEGDFSFAVFDKGKRELFCAQSCFPPLPWYFVRRKGSFGFASRIVPLLALMKVPKQLNERALADALTFAEYRRDTPLDRPNPPVFAGVDILPAATWLKVSTNGTVSTNKYWEPNPAEATKPFKSDAECHEALRELILRVVHDRLRSHRPLACYLSGGLDSSSITCIAARKLREQNERVTAIASVLPEHHRGPETDERHFVDIVKERENLDLLYVYPEFAFTDDLTSYLDYFERPVFHFQHVLYRAFYKAASSRSVAMILDGVGGEMGPSHRWNKSNCARRIVKTHARGFVALYRRIRELLQPAGIGLPIQKDFAAEYEVSDVLDVHDNAFRDCHDLTQYLCKNIQSYQAQVLLYNSSLAYGIRTYYPFLDRRIAEFCLKVPLRLYADRNLIRNSMEGILPKEIQQRRCKQPVIPDFYQRFRNEYAQLRRVFLTLDSAHPVRQFLNIDLVVKQLDALAVAPGSNRTQAMVYFQILAALSTTRFLEWFDQLEIQQAAQTEMRSTSAA